MSRDGSRNYHSNIPKYFVYSALRGAAVGTPIVLWVVFLQRHYGYSLTQVTLIDLPFWLGKFLFEIPTGVVADRYGRKLSMGLAATLGSLIWLVFASSGEFWVMATAQFAGGLAATFSSGADEALLFETTRLIGREDEYAKITARAGAVRTASAMIAGVAVGVIASVDLVLPVLITSGLIASLLIPILSFTETLGAIGTGEPEQPKTTYLQVVREALATLREHVTLRWAIAYLVIISSIGFYAEVFLQPYTLLVGLPIAALGVVMVVVQGMSIFGSLAVPGARKALGTNALLYGAPLLLVPCLLIIGIAQVLPVMLVVALAAFLFAVCQPVMLAVVQGHVTNQARATVLSIQSLVATIFLTLTEPGLGVLSDMFGVGAAYIGMAALLALFCVPLLWKGSRWLVAQTKVGA